MPKSVRTEALANVFQICLSASAAAANVAMQPPAIAKASDTHTHNIDTRTHTHTHRHSYSCHSCRTAMLGALCICLYLLPLSLAQPCLVVLAINNLCGNTFSAAAYLSAVD